MYKKKGQGENVPSSSPIRGFQINAFIVGSCKRERERERQDDNDMSSSKMKIGSDGAFTAKDWHVY